MPSRDFILGPMELTRTLSVLLPFSSLAKDSQVFSDSLVWLRVRTDLGLEAA